MKEMRIIWVKLELKLYNWVLRYPMHEILIRSYNRMFDQVINCDILYVEDIMGTSVLCLIWFIV